jgi:hypothetical protein
VDGVFEQDVEERLVPKDVCAIQKPGPGYMPHGVVNSLERAIGSEGNLGGDDSRFGEHRVAFVDFDEIGDPQLRGVGQKGRKFLEVEVTRLVLRKIDVADRVERYAHEKFQVLSRRLD